MRFLGPWSARQSYAAGDVVSTISVSYLCTHQTARGAAAPPADPAHWTLFAGVPDLSPTRIDSFTRDNQDGWGTASDGHVWATRYAGGGTIAIAGNRGVLTDPLSPSQNDFAQLVLGPPLIGDDRELLVRWTYTGASSNGAGPMMYLRLSADNSTQVFLRSNLNGEVNLETSSPLGNDSAPGLFGAEPRWGATISGATWWSRLRVIGQTYSLRQWLDGSPEPGTWDIVWTSSIATSGGFVALSGTDSTGGATLAYDSFSVVSPPP